MKPVETTNDLPGYASQTVDKITFVAEHKMLEEMVLRRIDAAHKRDDQDKRWLAIAQTHVQEAFMALNRATFQPQRLEPAADKIETFEQDVEDLIRNLLRKA
jgi:hypothetical protein